MAKASVAKVAAKSGLRVVESDERISGEHPKARTPRARKLGVVEQVALAFSRANLLSTIVGCIFGGFVPAAGFVVLIEGVMTFATHDALAGCALVLIVLVNGIAAGCRLSGVGK